MIATPQRWSLRDCEVDAGMEGDYSRWFKEHLFPRYTNLIESIPRIEEKSGGGEDGGDEGGKGRDMARGRARGGARVWGRYGSQGKVVVFPQCRVIVQGLE